MAAAASARSNPRPAPPTQRARVRTSLESARARRRRTNGRRQAHVRDLLVAEALRLQVLDPELVCLDHLALACGAGESVARRLRASPLLSQCILLKWRARRRRALNLHQQRQEHHDRTRGHLRSRASARHHKRIATHHPCRAPALAPRDGRVLLHCFTPRRRHGSEGTRRCRLAAGTESTTKAATRDACSCGNPWDKE